MLTRLLMIDDDPNVLYFAGKRFEKLGFKVCGARSGVEARQQIGAQHFDFAIVDLRMDEEDGIAIAADLQQKERLDLPIAFLTAWDSPAARNEAAEKQLQPFDWYPKPLPVKDSDFAALVDDMRPKATADRFRLLAQRWRAETKYLSSITDAVMHPSYQSIVGMGETALPLIIASLTREPDWWFWALKAITGDDPVPAASRGNLIAMTEAWLAWADVNGIRR